MKKILYSFLLVSIIFTSCEKEEDDVVAAPSIVGIWTPTSISVTSSMSVVVLGETIQSLDTTYTMTATEAGFLGDVEFTNDGKMYIDVDTNLYSYSDNMLTITDDEGTETDPCIVTSTDLTITFNDNETYIEDYMGMEATVSETNDMTLNCIRQ